MSNALKDKVAIVTGGASGIGRAAAIAFAREGAAVVVADVATDGGRQTVATIREAGGEALFIECDVSRSDDVRGMVEGAVEIYGRIDCAFNNAGIEGVLCSITELTEEQFDQVVRVNLKGIWLCMKHEIPHMVKQGKGAIVNMASISGVKGLRAMPVYSATKHGIVGLTRSAALEFAPAGVRINAVGPGGIDTPLSDRVQHAVAPELFAAMVAAHPLGRLGTPEEVAEAAVWLCSDRASFVTGHIMMVDGGSAAQ
jgi:NAD(P)-dependent dehydrogenase (short-subunit alcohol dehydrogenase family)